MKNVIFDFGNVLVRWQPELIYNEHFGDEARTWWFMRHVADTAWRLRIDSGESQDACVAELQEKYPDYAEAIALYRDRWREMLTGEMPGMRELVEGLKVMGYGIYGLTNWSMETFPAARRMFPVLQLIDRYIVSGDVGMVKPDPRIFQLLLQRFGLRPEETFFIDDNADNVAAARALGIGGIHFTSADRLKTELSTKHHITI